MAATELVYRFPVVRGVQAGNEYYIGMVPLGMLSKLFPSDDEYIKPEFRAQRKLNISRIPEIKNYILSNRNTYIFSALTASIDGKYRFVGSKQLDEIGILEISADAKLQINDGQHRKAAILEAIQEDESLKSETISIVFYGDLDLKRSQQMFTDLNKHAVKTSNSISELYDSRDSLAVITRHIINDNEFLNNYTDKERDNLGKYSSKLFTLNSFYWANRAVLNGSSVTEENQLFLRRFWNEVVFDMPQWSELANHQLTKSSLREDYISTQNVVIRAIGKVGNYFLRHPECDMSQYLKVLKEIDWRRDACQWRMRAINNNGRVVTNSRAITLISSYIKQKMGVPLITEELAVESSLNNAGIKNE